MIINPNHLILVSFDSLFHQLSVDSKFIKFLDHLSPQFNSWPTTIHF